MVDPRAPESSTGTFLNSARTYSCALASPPSFWRAHAHAARYDQRPPPDVLGLAVTTMVPGLTRSSQSRILRGLPLRTTNTTVDV